MPPKALYFSSETGDETGLEHSEELDEGDVSAT